MNTETFFCESCGTSWADSYSFWQGYSSCCPKCGATRQAVKDSQVYRDIREMNEAWNPWSDDMALESERDVANVAWDAWSDDRALAAERDVIHDEIAEAFGAAQSAAEAETDAEAEADADADGDTDADGDADADAGAGL